MKVRSKYSLAFGIATSVCMLGATAVSADEAEDNSAAFEASKAEIAATQGVSEAAATVTTSEDGTMSAVVGVSALKMLVVKQNEDGTLTYDHVSSDAEFEEFANAETTSTQAEE